MKSLDISFYKVQILTYGSSPITNHTSTTDFQHQRHIKIYIIIHIIQRTNKPLHHIFIFKYIRRYISGNGELGIPAYDLWRTFNGGSNPVYLDAGDLTVLA